MEYEQMTVPETPDNRWSCGNCQAENRADYKFCATCGRPRFTLDSEFGKRSVYSVMALYFTLLFGILFVYLANPGGYGWVGELYASLILACITLGFVFFDLQNFRRYIFPGRFNRKIFVALLFLAPAFSFVVSNLVGYVNRTFFDQDLGIVSRYSDAPNPLLYACVFTAVFPAVFEELAFRGVIFSRGSGVFSLKQTIWVSSILFTFLHLSVISFLWIMPFALVLGWLRARYRTTFYGMCIHFLHNFTAVMLEHYGYDNLL